MTQSAQSERARTALKASGIDGAPLMSLEREDALFVLTDDMLVYQDGGGTRRVTLRDLTRIHSDQAGLLRVETPAGTALTASLLGFDVAQVQSFFKGVRSATARAKDLPDSPTPTLGGAKTFGTAPAAGSAAAASPAQASPPPTAGSGATSGQPARDQPAGADAGARTPVPEVDGMPEASSTSAAGAAPSPRTVVIGEAAPQPNGTPAPETRSPEPRKGGGNAENPVVISSSSFSPHVSKPGLGAGGVASGGAAARPEPARPDLRKPQPSAAAPAMTRAHAAATPAEVPTPPAMRAPAALGGNSAPAPVDPSDAPPSPAEATPDTPPVTALSRVAAATALARQSGTVEALAGRLRMLGAVLFVGALALAFFQFTGDQALAGLWTLLAGGVGAIALLALGELSALLALLARAPGPAGSSVTDSGHDG
ncbi:hypothetical protein GCM10010840_05540 [Deinococcus aerolatus]|uniref:Uncharacterized protein n=1 Tax=Deinococcus aerolatus TaxID=522487 RepID=A0ABQ2G1B2_9DEIO|nr:hypothetical protein [Deinococcus aerolatus]GGL70356.1 hypothetical protein GCM10010840_05540 [Deinococcus aerolatus]